MVETKRDAHTITVQRARYRSIRLYHWEGTRGGFGMLAMSVLITWAPEMHEGTIRMAVVFREVAQQ
jgi:hypothetical protein